MTQTRYLDKGGTLLLTQEITSGGEARIFKTNRSGYVAKCYKDSAGNEKPVSKDKEEKLRKLIKQGKEFESLNIKSVIFPLDLLKNQKGKIVGFLMKEVEGIPLAQLFEGEQRHLLRQMSRSDLIDLCWRISVVFRFLHNNRILVGDVSANNILYHPATRDLFFIDVDSFLIDDYHSTAYTPDFYPPEFVYQDRDGYWQRKTNFEKTPKNEFFSVSLLLYYILSLGQSLYRTVGSEEAVGLNQVYPWKEANIGKPRSRQFFVLPETIRQLLKDCLLKNGKYYPYKDRPDLTLWVDALKDYQDSLPEMVRISPVYGQLEPENLERPNPFRATSQAQPNDDAQPTYQVIETFGSGYAGMMWRGKYHGKGKLRLADGYYEGGFANGEYHGYGKRVLKNGKIEEGYWEYGKLVKPKTSPTPKNSQQKVYGDGTVYYGDLKNNLPQGQGTYTWKNGNTYEGRVEPLAKSSSTVKFTKNYKSGKYVGEMKHDKRHGRGRFEFNNDYKLLYYDGDWHNDERTGHGEIGWKDGSRYVGQVFAGQPHGQGKLVDKNGNVKEGRFNYGTYEEKIAKLLPQHKQGKPVTPTVNSLKNLPVSKPLAKSSSTAKFTKNYKSGKYVGEMKHGKRHGRGRFEFNNDYKLLYYDGDWHNDERTGHGEIGWKDGSRYVGQVFAGQPHGQGKLVDKNGNVKEGRFNYGTYE